MSSEASHVAARGRFAVRFPLFRKYLGVIAGLVGGALVLSAVVHSATLYVDGQRALGRVQQEKAIDASSAIERFFEQLDRELSTAVRPQSQSLQQRRDDFNRLMAIEPAVVDLIYYDAQGREQLLLSRVELDREGAGTDMSTTQMVIQAKAGQSYVGPVFFRYESEPYLTMSVREKGDGGGVIAANINLKSVLDVIDEVKVGSYGYAYVVDSNGRLIAHKDVNLVLSRADMSKLPQILGARQELGSASADRPDAVMGLGLDGGQVLSAYHVIPSLDWFVFVEEPFAEAFAPIFTAIIRSLAVLLFGVIVAVIVALLLARSLVRPIRVLQHGAERIAGGDLDQRIALRTGDEIEALANDFNAMTSRLSESYAQLEQKVEERTAELRQSLERQTALSDVLRLISHSTYDLPTVTRTLLEHTVRLCDAHVGMIYRRTAEGLELIALHPANAEVEREIRDAAGRLDDGSFVGRVDRDGAVLNLANITENVDLTDRVRDFHERRGLHAALGVPLVQLSSSVTEESSEQRARSSGVMTLFRTESRAFGDDEIRLAQAFADQAAIAIENVRLVGQVQEKTREVQELRIEIDNARRATEVHEIVSSDFFQDLQGKAKEMRERHLNKPRASTSSLLARIGEPPPPTE